MRTVLLDRAAWDLVVDVFGNIAVADDPYSQAQDAASAIQLFQGEAYYDTTRGVPYWASILGKFPPINYMRAKFEAAALTVPGVKVARCFLASIKDRVVTGQVQLTNDDAQQSTSNFATTPPTG
jgi:hypothetical protein